MFIVISSLIAAWCSILCLSHRQTKKEFEVPWYYVCTSSDIGGNKGKLIKYKNIVGVPDAIFRHILFPIYIVGELKSRTLKNAARRHEIYQLQLYIGIMQKTKPLAFVRGVLAFKNTKIKQKGNRRLFRKLLSKRAALLRLKKAK